MAENSPGLFNNRQVWQSTRKPIFRVLLKKGGYFGTISASSFFAISRAVFRESFMVKS